MATARVGRRSTRDGWRRALGHLQVFNPFEDLASRCRGRPLKFQSRLGRSQIRRLLKAHEMLSQKIMVCFGKWPTATSLFISKREAVTEPSIREG
ncbi:MAG: hypothetical protein QOJ42_4128 [Acidobacteriaceae bacterium]|nr:hypothetical protein [Acidobacteriaceae bacterium]